MTSQQIVAYPTHHHQKSLLLSGEKKRLEARINSCYSLYVIERLATTENFFFPQARSIVKTSNFQRYTIEPQNHMQALVLFLY